MRSSSIEGKPRYIHCTPLHGSDGAPGVWMVVMVEKEDITGTINAPYNHNHRRRSSFGIVNGTHAQEKLFDQSQQVQQPHQYRMREPEGRDAVGGGGGGGGGGSTRRSRAQSTFYDDYNDDGRSMPASSAYAEYLATSSAATTNGGAVRSGSASRGPSRPPSRAATTGTSSWPPARPELQATPPARKMTPREETARMVRLPVFPQERLGEVDGE
ncbi:putative hisactophilin c49s mutant phototropin phy3 fusion protein [Diplodia seriata]|uniref:Putative hisactophilin c49s mutant phototropin phy3 fusion protein n=1 Tax=Diplodia seriata TaxID=420778 RepID=A0A0G2E780_9PEZI|nr:putative hisactophilin c49s mutant phototropin phy3 fusion protein [Diplodia seriata]